MSFFGKIKALSLHERKIAVAIDFGTTFSGVAWAKVLDVRYHNPPLLVELKINCLLLVGTSKLDRSVACSGLSFHIQK